MTHYDEILPLITVLLRLLDQCDQIQPDSTSDESGVLASTHQIRQALAAALPPLTAVQIQQTERLDRLSDLVIRAVNAYDDWIIADVIDARTLTVRDVWIGDGLAMWIARVLTLAVVEPLASKETLYRSLHQTFQAARHRIKTIRSALNSWEPPNDPSTTIDDVLTVVDTIDDSASSPIPAALELKTFIHTEITEIGAPWPEPMAWPTRYPRIDEALATACRQLDALVGAMVAQEDIDKL